MMNRVVRSALLIACAGFASFAAAQDYPSRPIRLIVPTAQGGMPDTICRAVAQRLSETFGQAVVIENRTSAGGIQGTEAALNAPADGYTMLQTDAGPLSINPHVYPKLSYDPLRDLAPVSLMSTSPMYMVVTSSHPANSLEDLVALAKKNPGKIFYGSPGTASLLHIAMEAFISGTGIQMVHVPYKGTAGTVPALLGGQVEVILSSLPAITGLIDQGKVRRLAVTSMKRSSIAPNVPSISEIVPDYDFKADLGIAVRTGTPPALIAKLSAEIAKAVRHPETVKRMAVFGVEAVGSTPEAYAALVKADYERYGKVVKLTGAKAD